MLQVCNRWCDQVQARHRDFKTAVRQLVLASIPKVSSSEFSAGNATAKTAVQGGGLPRLFNGPRQPCSVGWQAGRLCLFVRVVARSNHSTHGRMSESHFVGLILEHLEGVRMHIALHRNMG